MRAGWVSRSECCLCRGLRGTPKARAVLGSALKGSPPCPCTCWKGADHEWHIYGIYGAGAVKHPFISMGTDTEKEQHEHSAGMETWEAPNLKHFSWPCQTPQCSTRSAPETSLHLTERLGADRETYSMDLFSWAPPATPMLLTEGPQCLLYC